MTDNPIDDFGPVDYILVEFPEGTRHFTGEIAVELARLAVSGVVRVLDILILEKEADGSIEAFELDDLDGVDELLALETGIAEILAEDDILHLAEAMEPGSVAGVLIWENTWAAPFGAAVRKSGGQLVASGRIPIQAIVASLEAEASD